MCWMMNIYIISLFLISLASKSQGKSFKHQLRRDCLFRFESQAQNYSLAGVCTCVCMLYICQHVITDLWNSHDIKGMIKLLAFDLPLLIIHSFSWSGSSFVCLLHVQIPWNLKILICETGVKKILTHSTS